MQVAWRTGNPAFTDDSINCKTFSSEPLRTLVPQLRASRFLTRAHQIPKKTATLHLLGGSAFFLASGAQKRAGFCTPEVTGLMMAPVTQTHGAFARTAVMVCGTAAALMLRAESTRLGLRFKLSILPPFCPFVGFHPPLCPGWWNCVRCAWGTSGARASPPAEPEGRSTGRP